MIHGWDELFRGLRLGQSPTKKERNDNELGSQILDGKYRLVTFMNNFAYINEQEYIMKRETFFDTASNVMDCGLRVLKFPKYTMDLACGYS